MARKKKAARRQKPVRVGVVGAFRGHSLAQGAASAGMELVAICDIWKERLKRVGKELGVATYTKFEKFLEHDMDAVILANFFHEHAPFAVKALDAGLHVMSETSACKTLAEGVELCRAVERSGKAYMFAENYPYTAASQEMQRLYEEGELGRVLYAEGEYNHPMPEDARLGMSVGMDHWRNQIPPTYYCTHALAPLMCITDTMPTSVNCLAIADKDQKKKAARVSDPGAVILCQMDNGAVFRIFGLCIPGHSIWYRLHGTRGLMETVRGPGYWGPGSIRVMHDDWDRKRGELTERVYFPDFPEFADEARRAGHGGGDFWTNFHFVRAIRSGKQPYLDVYRGVAMSAVGILGWKSALENGIPFEMPDFKDESKRAAYADDHWAPFPVDGSPDQPAPSILGRIKPSKKVLEHARELWKGMGYEE